MLPLMATTRRRRQLTQSSRSGRRTAALLTGALLLAGCGEHRTSGDAGSDASSLPDAAPDLGATDAGLDDLGVDASLGDAPVLRHRVDMPASALAREALRLMGAVEAGGSNSCHDCHGITRESIGHFRELSDTAWSTCFTDLAVTTPVAAERVISCFRAAGNYSAGKLGIYSTGAYFEWFRYVFQRARGAAWEADYNAFVARVGMSPRGHTRWTQAEFDLVTEWFLRGTPQVETILLPPPPPPDCTSSVGPEVAAIVDESALTGWSARNRAASILMHGCAGASTASECLGTYPLASDRAIGAGWSVIAGSRARILFEMNYASSYWTRSSADGRFVAHGGSPDGSGAAFIDLQRGVVIGAVASYDPGFFPDNSGFLFQGGGTSLCEQSVLSVGAPTRITFTEPGCTTASSIGLYQHMGASLDGGDYFAVNSAWSGDNGGGADPTLFLDAGASVTFIAMINSGAGFVEDGSTRVAIPWEGSAVLSPSARTLVTQIANSAAEPVGYVLRRIDVTRSGSGPRTIALPEIARYCVPGGKPAISLDDRWLVTHHRATDADAIDLGFTGPTDPGFAPYRNVSNVYLVELATGVTTRITRMAPGQQALFPHFRSDGWLYYIVKTGTLPEYVVATDAAIVLGR